MDSAFSPYFCDIHSDCDVADFMWCVKQAICFSYWGALSFKMFQRRDSDHLIIQLACWGDCARMQTNLPSRTVDPYPKSVLYKGFSRVGCASVMIMFCMSSSLCLKRLSMNSLSKAKIYSPLHFICRILFQCLMVYHRHNIFNQYNRLTSIGLWCVEKTSTSNAHACHQLLSRTIAKQFSVTL